MMMPLCEKCTAFMEALLDKRIRTILKIGREIQKEDEARGCEPYDDIGESHCFHLMEVLMVLRGEETSGVYDEYGGPPKPPPIPTIRGPLFSGEMEDAR